MTVYFEAHHTNDLSEYDSLTGDVRWSRSPHGKYPNNGSLLAHAHTIPSYATKDISAGNDLYVRVYGMPEGGAGGGTIAGPFLRGRNAAGQNCWQLRAVAVNSIATRPVLDTWDNLGNLVTHDIELHEGGLRYTEMRILSSAGGGQVEAWVFGGVDGHGVGEGETYQDALQTIVTPDTLGANDQRVTKYLDVGQIDSPTNGPCWLDTIKASDEWNGPTGSPL